MSVFYDDDDAFGDRRAQNRAIFMEKKAAMMNEGRKRLMQTHPYAFRLSLGDFLFANAEGREKYRTEVVRWCEENCEGEWLFDPVVGQISLSVVHSHYLFFADHGDAALYRIMRE